MIVAPLSAAEPFRRGEACLASLSACVTADQGDACVRRPYEGNLGPPKEKPGAVTAPGFGIVRKDAFSYLNPVSLSRDFSDFRTLDAGLAQGQDGATPENGH